MKGLIARLKYAMAGNDLAGQVSAVHEAERATARERGVGDLALHVVFAEMAAEAAAREPWLRPAVRAFFGSLESAAAGRGDNQELGIRLLQMDFLANIAASAGYADVAHEVERVASAVASAASDVPMLLAALRQHAAATEHLALTSADVRRANLAVGLLRRKVELVDTAVLPEHWVREVHSAHAKLLLARLLWNLRDLIHPNVSEIQSLAWYAAEKLDKADRFSSDRALALVAEASKVG